MGVAMTDSMLPILRQMHDAETDQERARLLLQCPDAILLKYRAAFDAACQRARFDLGVEFITWRTVTFHAVRLPDGNLPADDQRVLAAFAAFASRGGAA